jgi:hypothetical protein
MERILSQIHIEVIRSSVASIQFTCSPRSGIMWNVAVLLLYEISRRQSWCKYVDVYDVVNVITQESRGFSYYYFDTSINC